MTAPIIRGETVAVLRPKGVVRCQQSAGNADIRIPNGPGFVAVADKASLLKPVKLYPLCPAPLHTFAGNAAAAPAACCSFSAWGRSAFAGSATEVCTDPLHGPARRTRISRSTRPRPGHCSTCCPRTMLPSSSARTFAEASTAGGRSPCREGPRKSESSDSSQNCWLAGNTGSGSATTNRSTAHPPGCVNELTDSGGPGPSRWPGFSHLTTCQSLSHGLAPGWPSARPSKTTEPSPASSISSAAGSTTKSAS